MLQKFSVKNFKNFKDEIVLDFGAVAGYLFSSDCITDGVISKILIYGRNATGKTNLGEALMDIGSTMFGRPAYSKNEIFLNADSGDDSAVFSYTFRFGEKELVYQYARLSRQELKKETLMIDGNVIYSCDFLSGNFMFDNLSYIQAETANIDRYKESILSSQDVEESEKPGLPFLRWLVSNVALDNSSIIIRLANYVRRMTMVTVSNGIRSRALAPYFYDSLEDPLRLNDLEEFLNIMGIDCKLKLVKLPDGHNQLYFSHERLVPFSETASSGTLALVDLYRRIFPINRIPSFIFLDEFDAFYHYEMAENVIRFLKKRYPRSQIIMTSHNTNLMTNKLMRPDCMFILSGKGILTTLCNATGRELREGHNLEKMYISGEFEKYE